MLRRECVTASRPADKILTSRGNEVHIQLTLSADLRTIALLTLARCGGSISSSEVLLLPVLC